MPAEIVADYGDQSGESPHWDERTQTLFWTDLTGERFYRYLAAGNRHEIVHAGLQVSGFALLRNRDLTWMARSKSWTMESNWPTGIHTGVSGKLDYRARIQAGKESWKEER